MMRQWMFLGLGALMLACSGGALDSNVSPLFVLCVEACAHVRAKNCFNEPAIQAEACPLKCEEVQAITNSPCTDEHAELYACTARASISCNGDDPVVNGCEEEGQTVAACQEASGGCIRSPGSDDICPGFVARFFVCSDGVFPSPECVQKTGIGFCCP